MYEKQHENKLIQSLTEYLQYFKSYFSLTISLIQYHIYPQKSNQTNWENLTNKILNKKSTLSFTHSPFQIGLQFKIKSNIDRFYLRLIQFLQYRLSLFKSDQTDSKIVSFIQNYLKSLNKIFKSVSENQQNQNHKNSVNQHYKQTLGHVFMEIGNLIKKLVYSVFAYLQKINTKNSLILDQLSFSKQIVQEHILKHIYYGIVELYQQNKEELFNSLQSQNKWKKHKKWTDQQQFYSQNLLSHQAHRTPSFINSQKKLTNFHSLHSQSLRQTPFRHNHHSSYDTINEIKSKFQNVNHQQKQLLVNGQNYSISASQGNFNKNKKQSYYSQLSIMEIQDVQVYSKSYIMNQLQEKNIKNQAMINKFIKGYNKKYKKIEKAFSNLNQQKKQISSNYQEKQYQKQDYFSQNKSKSQLNVMRPHQFPGVIKNNRQRKISQFQHIDQKNTQFSNMPTPVKQVSGPTTVVLKHKNDKYNTFQAKQENYRGQQPKNFSIQKQMSVSINKNNLINKNKLITNIQFQNTNKDTFIFRQQQKQYFQSLKSKMNHNFKDYQNFKNKKQMSLMTSGNIHKTIQQEIMSNKEISNFKDMENFKNYNQIIQSKLLMPQNQKQAIQNIIKQNHSKKYKKYTVKGSNYSSSINSNKVKISQSQVYTLNQKDQRQALFQPLQGSSINHKRLPMKGKLFKVLQNSHSIDNNLFTNLNKVPENKSSLSIVDSETTVIILPKIPSIQRHLNVQK